VHGFVLAGGLSTRMGQDKALLRFCGKPMVQIALEKLQAFCAEVSLACNRDDLAAFGEVVRESRSGIGPAAGVEAGLLAARMPWALFMPVDVPLMPSELLREWVRRVISGEDNPAACASYLAFDGQPQAAFCLIRRECAAGWTAALDAGERRLLRVLRELHMDGFDDARPVDLEDLARSIDCEGADRSMWCCNVNTREEFARAVTNATEMQQRLHHTKTT
jgi:molybdopterin-guanine dinucleotide biosynthesis protein A